MNFFEKSSATLGQAGPAVDKAILAAFLSWGAMKLYTLAICGLMLVVALWHFTWWAGAIAAALTVALLRLKYREYGLALVFNRGTPAGGLHDVHENAEVLRKLAEPYQLVDGALNYKDEVFLGFTPGRKSKPIPVALKTEVFDKNHVAILGASGTGKSKIAALILDKLHREGRAVMVFDPKADEFMPGILARSAQRTGRPFVFINLREDLPQVNPLRGATRDQVEDLLTAGLNLDPSGNAAVDFHRGEDRDACAALVSTGITNIPDMVAAGASLREVTSRQNFWREFRDLARLKVFHTADGGPDLAKVIEEGGVIYVVGDTDSLRVQAGQRLLLARVLQIIKGRERAGARQVALFMDEFKYMLSNSALRALGTIRDRRCNLILAFQSYGDLEDCSSLPPKAVLGAAKGNTTLKIVYKLEEAATAKEFSELAGDERTFIDTTNKTLNEAMLEDGSWREQNRKAVTVDMLTTNLPKPLAGQASVGWVFGLGPAFPLSTMHLPAGPQPVPQIAKPVKDVSSEVLNAQGQIDLAPAPVKLAAPADSLALEPSIPAQQPEAAPAQQPGQAQDLI